MAISKCFGGGGEEKKSIREQPNSVVLEKCVKNTSLQKRECSRRFLECSLFCDKRFQTQKPVRRKACPIFALWKEKKGTFGTSSPLCDTLYVSPHLFCVSDYTLPNSWKTMWWLFLFYSHNNPSGHSHITDEQNKAQKGLTTSPGLSGQKRYLAGFKAMAFPAASCIEADPSTRVPTVMQLSEKHQALKIQVLLSSGDGEEYHISLWFYRLLWSLAHIQGVFSQWNYRHFSLSSAVIAFHVLKGGKWSVTRQTGDNCWTPGPERGSW